jgi:hypothetical protein
VDTQYFFETFSLFCIEHYWVFFLWVTISVGYLCWCYRKLTVFFSLLPILLIGWIWFEITGGFSSYDMVRRDGAFIYTQEQYEKELEEWFNKVDSSKGRVVSVFSCPQINDNGTKYIWVEIAYQLRKPWYEPIWFR